MHDPETCRNGDHYGQCSGATPLEDVTITVIPDPCWTPEMDAAAQSWLDLIDTAASIPKRQGEG